MPNPFFGVAEAGQFASQATDRARPAAAAVPAVRQRLHGDVDRRAFAVPRRHFPAAQARQTACGAATSATPISRLNDNQFGESNYYSSNPGIQNNYEVVPGSPLLQPGLGVRAQPARLAAQGRARADGACCRSVKARSSCQQRRRRTRCSAAGRSPPVVTLQSGFPIGVTQNRRPARMFLFGGTPRPNIVAGQDFLAAGRHHRPHHRERRPTTCTSTRPRSRRRRQPVRQRAAHAARRLLAVAQQRRPVGQQERHAPAASTSATDPPRSAEPVQHRAVGGAGELAFGNSSFGQITNQANNMRMVQFTLRFGF